jgi:hypothetical protein
MKTLFLFLIIFCFGADVYAAFSRPIWNLSAVEYAAAAAHASISYRAGDREGAKEYLQKESTGLWTLEFRLGCSFLEHQSWCLPLERIYVPAEMSCIWRLYVLAVGN